MAMAASPGSPSQTILLSAASALLLPQRHPLHAAAAAAHVPFGYQSDSTHSVEYRNPPSPGDGGVGPWDPSSYAGSARYDARHHALYVTGATFASTVFDGADVYGLTTEEREHLEDADPRNDGYWWDDMMTGLSPHLLDPGVPQYSPRGGDCFYAVFALPTGPGGGEDSEGGSVKLVHSRRFGSEDAAEACSAADVLLPSPGAGGWGDYAHDFSHPADPFGPLGPPVPPAPAAATGEMGGTAAGGIGVGGADGPAASPGPVAAPSPLENTGPQSRFRALEGKGGHYAQGRRRGELVMEKFNATDPLHVEGTPTRSVRILMAGHVESSTGDSGYVVSDLPSGQYDEAQVYAFAQQVDVRLPMGPVSRRRGRRRRRLVDNGGALPLAHMDGDPEYNLHQAAMEEEKLAQDLGRDWMKDVPKDDFSRVVTSGVESRALLNDHVPGKMQAMYPVSLVADPTSKRHFYALLIASDGADPNPHSAIKSLNSDPTIGQGATQRAWEDHDENPGEFQPSASFGPHGRPKYGLNYRVIVKKMTIESIADPAMELTDAEQKLAATSYEGETIAMRHTWMQEFEPDEKEDVRPSGLLYAPSGDAHGSGDVLVMVGTTAGRGSAFGTFGSSDPGTPDEEDLDGFVTKIRADDGNAASHNTFDQTVNQFVNTHSMRIETSPGKDELLTGTCMRPLSQNGPQRKTTHVYVVGSTGGVIQGIQPGLRDDEFLAKYAVGRQFEGGRNQPMEAFLTKINLDTMEIVWTAQVGAVVMDANVKVNALGYGCAVVPDGENVYLTGLVKGGGVATDFSAEDMKGVPYKAAGGTDVFVASYNTQDGTRNFLRQVGSARDDFPSRGNGGIGTDRSGNAVLVGSTRGSLMRKREGAEFRYGADGAEAASDVFVMSFARWTGQHATLIDDVHDSEIAEVEVHVPAKWAPGEEAPVPTPAVPVPQPNSSNQADTEKKKGAGALVEVVAIFIALILMSGLVGYRIKLQKKKKEQDVLMANTNLHDGRRGSVNLQSRRKSMWAMRRTSSSAMDFGDLNIMVEVRNSASGGWHGVYDDEQLQAIDFGVPTSTAEPDPDEEREQSLFMEDGLKEIEESMHNYEIGDMDDVSDDELLRAYNEAMALDIEPESPDVEFAMQGLGSDVLDQDHHKIT